MSISSSSWGHSRETATASTTRSTRKCTSPAKGRCYIWRTVRTLMIWGGSLRPSTSRGSIWSSWKLSLSSHSWNKTCSRMPTEHSSTGTRTSTDNHLRWCIDDPWPTKTSTSSTSAFRARKRLYSPSLCWSRQTFGLTLQIQANWLDVSHSKSYCPMFLGCSPISDTIFCSQNTRILYIFS